MDAEFRGKRALVTGGGRGIGRDIAESLARCGAKTFVLTKSDSSVESLRSNNPDIEVTQVDIADWDNARKAVEAILPIDLLVNNAGIFHIAKFVDVTETDINEALSVNYKAVFNISQIVARDLIRRNRPGSIVNISSVAALKCLPNVSSYSCSKAAQDSLTRYMAFELGCKQIRVNAVNPTTIPTDMSRKALVDPVMEKLLAESVPLGRYGMIREVTDVALFLLSDRASLVNGVTLAVDGGHAL